MKLIVGLGNPGKQYEDTRHNVGFMVLDYFASLYGVCINKSKFNGLYEEISVDGNKVMLLKPQSYMNLSGEVVSKFIHYFKISVDDILVINDDLDLPFLKVRLRAQGSSGGHNGLKNIEQHLGTNCYKRLKIGIANDKGVDTKDYVLGKFSNSSLKEFRGQLDYFSEILSDFCKIDFLSVVNKYN